MQLSFSIGISRFDLETATLRITAVPVITATPACFSLGEKRFRAGMPPAAPMAAWLWIGGTPPLLSSWAAWFHWGAMPVTLKSHAPVTDAAPPAALLVLPTTYTCARPQPRAPEGTPSGNNETARGECPAGRLAAA